MPRSLDSFTAPAPWAASAGGLAVDERGEAIGGRGVDQLRDQLPGVGLHATGVAGNEEDEVEAVDEPGAHRVHGGRAGRRRQRPEARAGPAALGHRRAQGVGSLG